MVKLICIVLFPFITFAGLHWKNFDFSDMRNGLPPQTDLRKVSRSSASEALNVSLIGQIPYGQTFAINSRDSLLYYSKDRFLIIADYSDPRQPVILSRTYLSFYNIGRIIFKNNLLLILGQDVDALLLVDVSDVRHPVKLDYIYQTSDAALYGNYVYGASRNNKTYILDISDSTDIKEVSFFNAEETGYFVYIQDHYLYRDNGYNLEIFDISNPLQPLKQSGLFTEYNHVRDAVYENGLLYCAVEKEGLWIIDVQDKNNPVVLDRVQLGDTFMRFARRLAKKENRVYIANGSGGLAVVDVTNPEDAKPLNGITELEHVEDVHIKGDRLFFSDKVEGVYAANIVNRDTLEFLYNDKTFAYISDVAVNDSIAFLVDWKYGLRIVDISNPAFPLEINRLPSPGEQHALYLTGDSLYVSSDRDGLWLYDVSDPMHIKKRHVLDKYIAMYARVSGNYLYLCTRGLGVRIYDIRSWREVGSFITDSSVKTVNEVIIREPYAYATTHGYYVRIYDISHKDQPQFVNKFTTRGASYLRDVALDGDLAYTVANLYGMEVFNIADPYNVYKVSEADHMREFSAIIIQDHYAYLLKELAGLGIYDISDTSAYPYVGEYETVFTSYDFRVKKDTVYLADGYDGLYILWHDRTTAVDDWPGETAHTFILEQNYPNPFNLSTQITYELPQGGWVELKVYDINGRSVATLLNAKQPAGHYTVPWQADNLASGVYFYRLVLTAGTKRTVRNKKCILLK